MYTLNNRLNGEYWPDKYEELNENQKIEVRTYKERNKELNQKTCLSGIYKPSNYYRDELNVYGICLKLNGVIFNISPNKKVIYNNNVLEYETLKKDNENYEIKNNINSDGYEK
jgi:hypothetical protein